MVFLLLICILVSLITLSLSLDVHRRLRSNSIFTWSRAWLLRTSSLLAADSDYVAVSWDITSHEVVVLRHEAKRVWRRTSVPVVMATFRHASVLALGVWTSWSFLSSSRSETLTGCALTWPKTALSSLVLLACLLLGGTWFSTCNYLAALALHAAEPLERIHFVFKCCCSDRSTRFKDTQLLLVEDLAVRKSLVLLLTKMRGAHHLLRHHQVVLLGPIHSFWAVHALNASHTKGWPRTTHSSDVPDPARGVFVNTSRSILILVWHFWAVSFKSDHTTANAHDSVLNISTWILIVGLICLLLLSRSNLTWRKLALPLVS